MMQNKIQLVVFLAGILSKVSGDLYRFVLIEEPKTWKEAQSYCREKHTDLATVQSDEDRAKLKEAANAVNFQSFAWIGFSNVWRWSYQNKVVSYEKWGLGEPDLSNTDEACAFVKKSGRWEDTYCTELKYFFCQTDYITLQDKFRYIEVSMNWYDAQIHCRSYYVDLASVTDDTEKQVLIDKLTEKQVSEAWIGLYMKLGQWQWSDNASVLWSSVKWESGQPDYEKGKEFGARADIDGQLADDSCSTRLPFYCRENENIVHRVRFTLKSDGHLDESAVMEAIEKTMKQILSDQDISITWSVQPDGNIFQQQKTQENKQERCQET